MPSRGSRGPTSVGAIIVAILIGLAYNFLRSKGVTVPGGEEPSRRESRASSSPKSEETGERRSSSSSRRSGSRESRSKGESEANASLPAQPQMPPQTPGEARIGCFNIEWLSLDGKNARKPEDLRRIADVIRSTGTVLLGLEEIQDEEVLAALARELPGWKYTIGTSGRQQRCAILWDSSRASVGRAVEWPDVNAGVEKGGAGSLRAPLVAPARVGKFDFLFVVLHLKAMFEPEDMRTRRQQLSRIRARLDEQLAKSPDKDAIIVGDYNDFLDSNAMKELLGRGKGGVGFIAADGKLPETVRTYLGRGDGRIDHVVFTSPAVSQEEWTGTAEVYPKPRGQERKAYETSVSDHLPIWATFRTDRDNDP